MQINTKYDIGQELWYIYSDDVSEWHIFYRKLIVEYIKYDGSISYMLKYEHRSDNYEEAESDIEENYFTTRELAQSECDRRNAIRNFPAENSL